MRSASFPFPDKALAMKELKADPASRTLGEQECTGALDAAWKLGESTAEKIWEESGHEGDFLTILKNRGVKVSYVHADNVAGGMRYFSVYETGKDEIKLYTVAIRLWADMNEIAYDTAANLILGHEFFHYLEANEIGFASKLVSLPIIRIGTLRIGEKGIRALSEVGAHAFARTYFSMSNPAIFRKGAEEQ
jgi:hypothetical protein